MVSTTPWAGDRRREGRSGPRLRRMPVWRERARRNCAQLSATRRTPCFDIGHPAGLAGAGLRPSVTCPGGAGVGTSHLLLITWWRGVSGRSVRRDSLAAAAQFDRITVAAARRILKSCVWHI